MRTGEKLARGRCGSGWPSGLSGLRSPRARVRFTWVTRGVVQPAGGTETSGIGGPVDAVRAGTDVGGTMLAPDDLVRGPCVNAELRADTCLFAAASWLTA
jgi:hypothetical protein